jgi:hypothetical protein
MSTLRRILNILRCHFSGHGHIERWSMGELEFSRRRSDSYVVLRRCERCGASSILGVRRSA